MIKGNLTRREARDMIERAYEDARYDSLDRSVFENSLGIMPGRRVSDRSDFELRKILDGLVAEKMIAPFEKPEVRSQKPEGLDKAVIQ